MSRRPLKVWLRLQETPTMTLALFLGLAAIINLVTLWNTLSVEMTASLVVFAVGSFLITAGVLKDDRDLEAGGLYFFLASLLFLLLEQFFKHPITLQSTAYLLVSIGAYFATFGIRLWVVRKAARARRLAVDIVAGKGTKHGRR